MKGTHPQPRSPRRTTFRAGFRTGLRAGRRAIMWAALLAAIAIGVVWAGGGWTTWHVGPFESPQRPRIFMNRTLPCCIGAWGQRGGFGVRHWNWDPQTSNGPGSSRGLMRAPWMWSPSGYGMLGDEYWLIRVPYWIPTLLCLTTFALLFRIERRERRLARAGHCVCGYSLDGLGEGAVCPECGTSGR